VTLGVVVLAAVADGVSEAVRVRVASSGVRDGTTSAMRVSSGVVRVYATG
jgi:hypothetical protein